MAEGITWYTAKPTEGVFATNTSLDTPSTTESIWDGVSSPSESTTFAYFHPAGIARLASTASTLPAETGLYTRIGIPLPDVSAAAASTPSEVVATLTKRVEGKQLIVPR